jgi:hypothetical protein
MIPIAVSVDAFEARAGAPTQLASLLNPLGNCVLDRNALFRHKRGPFRPS